MPFSGPAEDRLAIRDLIDAYADAVTRNDGHARASTWAEDGEWLIPDGAGKILVKQDDRWLVQRRAISLLLGSVG
jgi:hypothetical protein